MNSLYAIRDGWVNLNLRHKLMTAFVFGMVLGAMWV